MKANTRLFSNRWDLVSVPQGVMRAFRNISDVTGRLYVTIELGEPGKQ